jgi:hypothetical protein
MTTTPKVWRATQQANSTDAGVQFDPAIADIGSGRCVVVWTEGAGGPIATAPGSDLVGQISTRGVNLSAARSDRGGSQECRRLSPSSPADESRQMPS